jgi:hypothetical protein
MFQLHSDENVEPYMGPPIWRIHAGAVPATTRAPDKITCPDQGTNKCVFEAEIEILTLVYVMHKTGY